MLEHLPFPDNVSDVFLSDDCGGEVSALSRGVRARYDLLSSLRIYLRAKVKAVSLRSTMRTLPKAPLPTTRKSLKWLSLTVGAAGQHAAQPAEADEVGGVPTFIVGVNGLALLVAHDGGGWKSRGSG